MFKDLRHNVLVNFSLDNAAPCHCPSLHTGGMDLDEPAISMFLSIFQCF